MHPLAARHDVLMQRAARRGGFAGRDAVDDFAVLAGRDRQRAGVRQRCPAEQIELVDQPPVGDEKLGIACELDQPVVEREVGLVIGVDVALGRRLFHAVDARGKLAGEVRRDRLGDAAAGEFVEHRAQLVDLVGLVDPDFAHVDTAILLEPDEARFFQRAKGFADRAARDAQEIGDRRFVQLAARAHLAGEDHPLELLLDEHRQR